MTTGITNYMGAFILHTLKSAMILFTNSINSELQWSILEPITEHAIMFATSDDNDDLIWRSYIALPIHA